MVAFRDRIRNWLQGSQQVTEAAPAAPKTPERSGFEYGISPGGLTEYNSTLGGSTQTDRRSLMTQLYESYLACPWSWASVNAISRTITAGGLVTDWDQDDGEGDQEQPDKPSNVLALERLLAYCNPREDIRQLMRSVIADLLVFGDAFLEVVWLAGQPVALYSLDSPTMCPIADEHGEITGYVQITDYSQRAEFEPHEVIHISLDAPRSGIFGVSPTQAALLPITNWLFAAATLKEIYRKGNPPDIHWDFPSSYSTTEMNRWSAMYMQRNVGPRNIGMPKMTKGGAVAKELATNRIEEHLRTLDQKRDEILASYGVPPAEATVIESGHLGAGTGEAQRKTFQVNTCQPIAELVLEKINFHIVKQGFDIAGWHLKFGEVDMRDSETIEKIRDMRLRNGAWVLNRYRTEIGEPPVDGGDDAILVDRQNLVLWSDMNDMSKAMVAKTAAPAMKAGSPQPEADQPGIQGLELPPEPGAPPDDSGGETAPRVTLTESWRRDYRERHRLALEELPRLEAA